MPLLAGAWHNTTLLAEARRRALEPDSPLVIEVLACFDTVQSLFADEIQGDAEYVTVDPAVASTALKAIRDGVAAAYALPVLTAAEHAALMRAWRSVYPTDRIADPDLGVRAEEVTSLVAAIPRLAAPLPRRRRRRRVRLDPGGRRLRRRGDPVRGPRGGLARRGADLADAVPGTCCSTQRRGGPPRLLRRPAGSAAATRPPPACSRSAWTPPAACSSPARWRTTSSTYSPRR